MTEPRLDSVQCLGARGLHRMAYWEWGDASAPHVVVCVHGLSRQGRDFDVLAQAQPGVGGPAGLAPHNQRTAHPLFQHADALRDRRRRHMQRAGRALKAAFSHHSSQGKEGCIVEHKISISSLD